MDRGVFVSRAEAENTLLSDLLDRYEREIVPAKKGAEIERIRISQFRKSTLSHQFIASIRGVDIALWRDARLKEVSPATVGREMNILGHVFETARKEWGLQIANPIRDIRRPPAPNARTRRLVNDELPHLLSAALTYGGEIGPIITWAIETAMRRGEITAMRWEHVDRMARVLLIPETKNGTPRRVPLSTAALRVLDTLPTQSGGRVWSLRPESISQAFERVCVVSGIEGLTFHDLRHEATSRLFEKGLNPMEVAAITGHKTLQMLKRYTHLRAEDLVGRLG
ncbi:MAG TPA: site-specific integrase [Acidiferrobacter sp.]|nr:site-specific integrase [Acidiferrobacter sp.]